MLSYIGYLGEVVLFSAVCYLIFGHLLMIMALSMLGMCILLGVLVYLWIVRPEVVILIILVGLFVVLF